MGKLFVISAPSGTGKTSLIQSALKDPRASSSKLGISCTTRDRRAEEIEGTSYFFISNDRFKKKILNDEFLEFAKVFGNYYGTPKDWVLATLEKKENVILELDTQGALQVKARFPEANTIFIIPPSYEDLQKRLEKRNQDTDEVINARLKEAKKEVSIGKSFDRILVNNDFDEALEDLKTFMFTNNDLSKNRKLHAEKSLDLLLD